MADNEDFANQGGDALEIGDDEFSEEEDDMGQDDGKQQESDDEPKQSQQPSKKQSPTKKEGKDEQIDGQHFDMAFEVNESGEEVDSGEEEDQVPDHQPPQKNAAAGAKPAALQKQEGEDYDDKPVAGAYNPADYANLNVTQDIKDLFIHITSFQPQKIDLDTKFKPFIPEYIPTIGEVDAQLKMPRPNGDQEMFGIEILDEPCLNGEDKTVLEMKWHQQNVGGGVQHVDMEVQSIENADKNPRDITRWIDNIKDLHDTRALPTVAYSKNMPNFDKLMEEWPPEMESQLQNIQFPGPEIDLHTSDYARLVCHMFDIPTHKLPNSKATIESLHMLFTLYTEFKESEHFKQKRDEQARNPEGANIATFD